MLTELGFTYDVVFVGTDEPRNLKLECIKSNELIVNMFKIDFLDAVIEFGIFEYEPCVAQNTRLVAEAANSVECPGLNIGLANNINVRFFHPYSYALTEVKSQDGIAFYAYLCYNYAVIHEIIKVC